MIYIKRSLENIVKKLAHEYPAIMITGPRQVGKTTMLLKLMEGTNRKYVSLDDLTNRALAKSDPEMFFQIHKPPILIDEVQYAPEIFPYIKILIDKNQNPGDFWLTGSQSFHMMDLTKESLAGRIAVLHMSSLSQSEIYGSDDSKPFIVDLEDVQNRAREKADTPEIFKRIFTGSMPSIVSGKYSDINIFYSSYLSTYIERDVKALSGEIDSLKFLKFITVVAARSSQMINVAEIAKNADIDQIQAKNWLNILEKSDIIFYLHPYSNNLLKRTVTKPKLYFFDTGLVSYLTKWSSPETLENGAMNGAILENYVVSEIVKSYHNSAKDAFIYYYRDKDTKEIDIILEADGMISPIEIKKTANPGSELVNVFKVLDKGAVKRGKGAILCMKEDISAIDKDNLVIPIWKI